MNEVDPTLYFTVYQVDYVVPDYSRYDYIDEEEAARRRKCVCPPPPPPPCKKFVPTHDFFGPDAEWTTVGPMGRLLEARVIPSQLTEEQVELIAIENREEKDCANPEGKHYDDSLPVLTETPSDEPVILPPKRRALRRPLPKELLSLYQVDYCVSNSFPDDGDLLPKLKIRPPPEKPPCEEFPEVIDEDKYVLIKKEVLGDEYGEFCDKYYTPILDFPQSNRFTSIGNGLAWPKRIFTTSPDYTEYQDTIHKNGCVIMKNNLHIHTDCENGRRCRHEIVYKCKYLK